MFATIEDQDLENLKIILSAGVDPNQRFLHPNDGLNLSPRIEPQLLVYDVWTTKLRLLP